MTTPVGPSNARDPGNQVTYFTQQITLAGANVAMSTYFNGGFCRSITPQADGTLYIQRAGDAGYTSYLCKAGVPITGQIVSIGASSSAIVVNLEL